MSLCVKSLALIRSPQCNITRLYLKTSINVLRSETFAIKSVSTFLIGRYFSALKYYNYNNVRSLLIMQSLMTFYHRGKDLIAQAQSGTGKTATFTIGVLQQLDYTQSGAQALILAPTRELAQQIQKVRGGSTVIFMVYFSVLTSNF